MIIELGTLDQEPYAFDLQLAAGGLNLDVDTARIAGTVAARGIVIKRTAQTDISGTIKVNVEMDCVRCLGPVESTRDIQFEAAYVEPDLFAKDREKEVPASDLSTDILPGDTVDLTEVLREQILLELPLQVFCSEDCKGLCAKCGANLNLIDCKCKESSLDPRWAALKDLE